VWAGLALILFGLVGIPLVTVVIDTSPPVFLASASYPSSTDASVPSIITQIGSATDFWAAVRDEGAEVESVTVRCTATDGSYDSGTRSCVRSSDLTFGGVVWEIWKWDAPILAAGKVYKFAWRATDKAGHVSTMTAYGGYGDADGYFSLNGVQITSPTQTLVLPDRTLDIGFHATKNPGSIVSVTVKIYKGSTLLKSGKLNKLDSDDWKTDSFYTFTADGTYTIKGYIDMSTKSLQKMSVIQQVGENGDGGWLDELHFSPLQILAFALGGLLVAYGWRGE